MSTSRAVVPLLIAAPILLLVGALGTAYAWLSDGLTSQGAEVTAAQYGVALVIGASAAIALIVVSRRGERTRLTRAGTITGAVLTGLAVLVSGLPFVFSVVVVVHNAVLSAQDPTAQETTSMADMRERSADFLDESVSVLGDVERDRESTVHGCQLSNLDSGDQLSSFEVLSVPTADRDELFTAIAARWESLGYELIRDESFMVIADQGWIESARVSWHADEGDADGTLAIDVTATCVVAD